MFKFYYATQTSATATRIALEEAKMPYEGVEVSWQRNVNVEELAKVNPLGQVPAAVINGKPVALTMALMEYIADNSPKAGLLPPAGSVERAEAMMWLAFCSSDLQKSFAPIFRMKFKRWELNADAQKVLTAKVTEEITKLVEHVDKNLAGKDFITGKNFTVADCLLFINLGFSKFLEFDLAPYKNCTAFMKRVGARPAVQKVLKEENMLDMIP